MWQIWSILLMYSKDNIHSFCSHPFLFFYLILKLTLSHRCERLFRLCLQYDIIHTVRKENTSVGKCLYERKGRERERESEERRGIHTSSVCTNVWLLGSISNIKQMKEKNSASSALFFSLFFDHLYIYLIISLFFLALVYYLICDGEWLGFTYFSPVIFVVII